MARLRSRRGEGSRRGGAPVQPPVWGAACIGVVPAVRFAAGRRLRSGDADRTAVPGRRRRPGGHPAPWLRAAGRAYAAASRPPALCGKCPIRKGIAKPGHMEPVGTSMDIFSRSVAGPGLAGGRPGMPIRAETKGKDSSTAGPRSTRWPNGDGAETLIRGLRWAPDGVAAHGASLRWPQRAERLLRPACPAPPRWPGSGSPGWVPVPHAKRSYPSSSRIAVLPLPSASSMLPIVRTAL